MTVRQALGAIVPQRFQTRLWVAHELRSGEPELRVLGSLLARGTVFVDIGANAGIYSQVALRHGCRVVAFEPVPVEAERLRRTLGLGADVHEVALSDRAGRAELHIPCIADREVTTRSSLGEDSDLVESTGVRIIQVELATLDSFALRQVGFIKVDVEGHELAVLEGAAGTIGRCRPRVLVEVEESRTPGNLANIGAFFEAMDYRGRFYDRSSWQPIDRFDVTVHQAERPGYGGSAGSYINNLLWEPGPA